MLGWTVPGFWVNFLAPRGRPFGRTVGLSRRVLGGAESPADRWGLIRSQGGWLQVLALRRREEKEQSNERILGGGNFVDRVLREAGERSSDR